MTLGSHDSGGLARSINIFLAKSSILGQDSKWKTAFWQHKPSFVPTITQFSPHNVLPVLDSRRVIVKFLALFDEKEGGKGRTLRCIFS
jgi:hypothetical protein